MLPFDTPKLVRNLSQQHWDCAIDDLRKVTLSSKKEVEGEKEITVRTTVSAGSSKCTACPCQPSLQPCWHFLVRNGGDFFTCETYSHGKLCAEETYHWKEPRKIVAVKVF